MKISSKILKKAAAAIVEGLGADVSEAALVADSLVRANMRGFHSHGVKYLTMLSKRVKEGMLNVPTHAELIQQSKAISLVDGKNGLGQVAGVMAMENAIDRAEAYGIAVTFVRNTNNIGFLSYYTMMAAKAGQIGICGCNAASSISLWGGTRAVLGSNPLSFAFPSDDVSPLVMDLSVSNVARGKIREADRLGESIPPTWAFGPDGNPTEDPAKALKGTLMPIGGPKGVGLAIAVDILAGMMSGSSYSTEVKTFHKLLGATGVGAFFIAVNPGGMMEPGLFKSLLSEYVVNIKSGESGKVFLPGEIENNNEIKSREQGIELDDMAIQSLNGMLNDINSDIQL